MSVEFVAGGMVHLERRVGQVMPLGEELLDPDADLVTVVALGNQDVRGRGRLAGGDLPDVQVVDLDHAVDRAQLGAERLRVDRGGRGLEEDPARITDE